MFFCLLGVENFCVLCYDGVMKIDEFFEKQFLVAGQTYDNFVFENCPDWFLNDAKQSLMQSANQGFPCIVELDRATEQKVEEVLACFDNEMHKKILARDFVVANVVKSILQFAPNEEAKHYINLQIDAFLRGDAEDVKKLHSYTFMPFDVRRMAKGLCGFELNFFLKGTQNQYLQQAVNLFVSAREPYCVKIFTNNERLATYYDTDGNIVQPPHDFMTRNVSDFVCDNEERKGE